MGSVTYSKITLLVFSSRRSQQLQDKMVQTIPELYSGKSIFLTGGTGFVGKVLIEKLLRSCPDVGNIYLLIRSKKGMMPKQRLEKILQDPVSNIFFCVNSNEKLKKKM